MGRLIVILFIILSGPRTAEAGAWLREKNSAFTAFAVTGFRAPGDTIDYKSSFYAEWGMRPNLTIGLDAEEHYDLHGHALAFARFPVAEFANGGRVSAEIGAGAYHRQTSARAMYKATLSWGKGFQTRRGSGWVAVDTAMEFRSTDSVIRKLDLTAGLSSNRKLNPMIQIETSYIPGRPFYWSARPSAMFRPGHGPNTWLVGIEGNAYQNSLGLKFALWREF